MLPVVHQVLRGLVLMGRLAEEEPSEEAASGRWRQEAGRVSQAGLSLDFLSST